MRKSSTEVTITFENPPISEVAVATHFRTPIAEFRKEPEERARETRHEYIRRIKLLRGYAEEDGIQVNRASEMDFWSFVRNSALHSNRARLALLDNGNLRAVWKGEDSSHVGIQFLGNQKAEYVIFKRRPASEDISRVAGIDTLGGVRKQIHAFALTSLVNV